MLAATSSNALSGFRSSGIHLHNTNVNSEITFAPSNVSDRPVEQVTSIPIQNIPQQDEYTTQVSLFRQSDNTSSAPSLSIHELLPTPKITRNPVKSRQSLKETATLVNRSPIPTDGTTVSSV
jgi:hypothetical protein